MTDRVFNFSAGPAILPEPVLQTTQKALWTLGSSGVGLLESSHRSAEFKAILEQTEATCRELAQVPDNYRVLFLQGGASSQFFMIPMNFLNKGDTADYISTGTWSKKAIKEARFFGEVHVAGSGEENKFTGIPRDLTWSKSPKYVHFTSNNTVAGTQWVSEPEPPQGAWLACDASSDIFSRPIDIAKYGIIYAGAQKNLGPSGVTLVIIRDDLVETAASELPTMLQYRTHAAATSCFNTPPTLGVFVIGEVLKWIKGLGGLSAMQEFNEQKAKLIYDALDESKLFNPVAEPGSRSLMNVCFRATNEALEGEFVAQAAKRGLAGLKGHRSVGGMRASIYNAFPQAGCGRLVEFLREFEKQHA